MAAFEQEVEENGPLGKVNALVARRSFDFRLGFCFSFSLPHFLCFCFCFFFLLFLSFTDSELEDTCAGLYKLSLEILERHTIKRLGPTGKLNRHCHATKLQFHALPQSFYATNHHRHQPPTARKAVLLDPLLRLGMAILLPRSFAKQMSGSRVFPHQLSNVPLFPLTAPLAAWSQAPTI